MEWLAKEFFGSPLKWAKDHGLWPVMLPVFCFLALAGVCGIFKWKVQEVFLGQWMRIGIAALFALLAVWLCFTVEPLTYRRFVIPMVTSVSIGLACWAIWKAFPSVKPSLASFILIAGATVGAVWLAYRAGLACLFPTLPADVLVVGIAEFTPGTGESAEAADKQRFEFRKNLETEFENSTVRIRRIPFKVEGKDEIEQTEHAKRLGQKPKGFAHVVLWGEVSKHDPENPALRLVIGEPINRGEPLLAKGPGGVDSIAWPFRFKGTGGDQLTQAVWAVKGFYEYHKSNYVQACEWMEKLTNRMIIPAADALTIMQRHAEIINIADATERLAPSMQMRHGGSIYTTLLGPDGTRRARVGDTLTATITIQNFDGFFDSLIITNVVGIAHKRNGPVTTPNLLPGGMPTTLTNFLDTITLTWTVTILPSDDWLLFYDVLAYGVDNDDGPMGSRKPKDFLLKFSHSVEVVRR